MSSSAASAAPALSSSSGLQPLVSASSAASSIPVDQPYAITSPRIEGPPIWTSIENAIYNYPLNPSESRIREMKHLLDTTIPTLLLSCPQCQYHYKLMIVEHPPPAHDRQALLEWWTFVHNEVSHRLGKPLYTTQQVVDAHEIKRHADRVHIRYIPANLVDVSIVVHPAMLVAGGLSLVLFLGWLWNNRSSPQPSSSLSHSSSDQEYPRERRRVYGGGRSRSTVRGHGAPPVSPEQMRPSRRR